MVEDIVRKIGYLALGTRMKRIGERLQAESLHIAEQAGAGVLSSQYPFLRAIDEIGPLTLGELAAAVGITQPGATRSVGQLVRLGMLTMDTDTNDKRIRIVSLTAAGRREIELAKREIWPRIEAAVAELCGELNGPLLDQLATVEDGLDELPLHLRPTTKEKTNR